MSEIVTQSLQKIAKGAGIIFTGTIIGMLLAFVSRVIIVRYITQSEYGIFSLALVLMSIFVTISTLGLGEGSTRYIAYHRGKNEEKIFFFRDLGDVISSFSDEPTPEIMNPILTFIPIFPPILSYQNHHQKNKVSSPQLSPLQQLLMHR